MEKINYGGPAFPHKVKNNGDELIVIEGVEVEPGYLVHFPGMTLRDCFAAKAMHGFAAAPDTGGMPIIDVARQAYLLANAMLAAREAVVAVWEPYKQSPAVPAKE